MFAVSASHVSKGTALYDKLARAEAALEARTQELARCRQELAAEKRESNRCKEALAPLEQENATLKKELNEARNGSQISARTVLAEVSLLRDMPIKILLSPTLKRDVVKVRHEAMYEVARRCPWMSLPEMARVFGRDHTTILYAIRHWPEKANELGIEVAPLGREVEE